MPCGRTLNVYDNVAYPLTIKRTPKGGDRKAGGAGAFHRVHLSQYTSRFPNQLSGGQQQRVALARALVAAPKLLLLDEPLSNLDAKLRESMRFEIKEIQRNLGITVVYVTHDQTEAMAMSDRILLINRGVVQQSGSPAEIYNRPVNQFVADFLGKVAFYKAIGEDGVLHVPEMGQSLAYDGSKRGKIELAIRPGKYLHLQNTLSRRAAGRHGAKLLPGRCQRLPGAGGQRAGAGHRRALDAPGIQKGRYRLPDPCGLFGV